MTKVTPQDRLKSVELRQRRLQEKVDAVMAALRKRRPELGGKSTDEVRKRVAEEAALPSRKSAPTIEAILGFLDDHKRRKQFSERTDVATSVVERQGRSSKMAGRGLPIPEGKTPDFAKNRPGSDSDSPYVESNEKSPAPVEHRALELIRSTPRENSDTAAAAAQAPISLQKPAVSTTTEDDEDRERMRAIFRKIRVQIRRQT